MTTHTSLSQADEATWTELVRNGISMSIFGLSDMVGKEVKAMEEIRPVKIPVHQAPDLLSGPEAITLAVYLQVVGAARGHMVLVFTPETAFDLIDLLLDQEPVATVMDY